MQKKWLVKRTPEPSRALWMLSEVCQLAAMLRC
jgi:hypothetical protein